LLQFWPFGFLPHIPETHELPDVQSESKLQLVLQTVPPHW